MVRERKSRPSFQTEGLDYHPEDGKQEWMVEILGEFQNSGKCRSLIRLEPGQPFRPEPEWGSAGQQERVAWRWVL